MSKDKILPVGSAFYCKIVDKTTAMAIRYFNKRMTCLTTFRASVEKEKGRRDERGEARIFTVPLRRDYWRD